MLLLDQSDCRFSRVGTLRQHSDTDTLYIPSRNPILDFKKKKKNQASLFNFTSHGVKGEVFLATFS